MDPPASGDLPRHIAIVMDGNGRWAAERGRSRLAGHRAGAAAVRAVVESCARLGVEALTLYVFSSENWSRPRAEVAGLFKMFVRFLKSETPELVRQGIRLLAIGRTGMLPAEAGRALARAIGETAAGGGMALVLAVNYGGQDEIVDAARRLAREAREGRIDPGRIDRADVERSLHTAGLPPVDLLIRTGGDMRISNFLLWQISYAELYFTRTYWPDFSRDHLVRALESFARRERRFGGLRD